MRPSLKTTHKLEMVLCRSRSWYRWSLRVSSNSALFCDSAKLDILAVVLGASEKRNHLLIPYHRAHLYLPKVIYTTFICYLHGDLQVGMNCGSSLSSYICRQLFSPPGNLAAPFVPAVTWEDTCSRVSTLYQNHLVWVHSCRRVMGKLSYCRVPLPKRYLRKQKKSVFLWACSGKHSIC